MSHSHSHYNVRGTDLVPGQTASHPVVLDANDNHFASRGSPAKRDDMPSNQVSELLKLVEDRERKIAYQRREESRYVKRLEDMDRYIQKREQEHQQRLRSVNILYEDRVRVVGDLILTIKQRDDLIDKMHQTIATVASFENADFRHQLKQRIACIEREVEVLKALTTRLQRRVEAIEATSSPGFSPLTTPADNAVARDIPGEGPRRRWPSVELTPHSYQRRWPTTLAQGETTGSSPNALPPTQPSGGASSPVEPSLLREMYTRSPSHHPRRTLKRTSRFPTSSPRRRGTPFARQSFVRVEQKSNNSPEKRKNIALVDR